MYAGLNERRMTCIIHFEELDYSELRQSFAIQNAKFA